MKGKRIWILMLCCMLVLSLAAVPGRAADTGKTYTVTITSQICREDGTWYAGTNRKPQYQAGQTVTVTPSLVVVTHDDVQFQGWELPDELTLTTGDENTEEIAFVMPERDITLTASFKIIVPLYGFSVSNNITGARLGGAVPAGNHRPVSCGEVEGYWFVEWENLEGLTILEGDKSSENITFVMPDHAVTLKALFTRFDDVLPGAYYFDPVLWAVERGITNGTTDRTFSPGNTCTTANILTFLWRANGSPEPSAANPFSDVPSGSYYEKAAVWAYENGLVSGNAFNGGSACTRAATMKYLWILAGRPASGTTPFTDVSPNTDYAKAVSWAVAQGVTNGTTATTFSPDNTCTRGQIATFLYRHYAQ